MQQSGALMFRTDTKEFRTPTVSSSSSSSNMRPPPPPAPKGKDTAAAKEHQSQGQQQQRSSEEPSSSMPDLGELLLNVYKCSVCVCGAEHPPLLLYSPLSGTFNLRQGQTARAPVNDPHS